MVDTEVVAGLAIGYFGSQFLGNFIEGKVKPGILDTSTSQDKMIAGVANDGSKAALAYGAYRVGQTSPFMKNIAWGSALAAVIDAGWRYSHNGVPYGYKPFNIPLLGDLNEIIAGPNSGSEDIRTMDACSNARAAADRACTQKTPVPVPKGTPAPAPDWIRRYPPVSTPPQIPIPPVPGYTPQDRANLLVKCHGIKVDATIKRRQYTKAEKDMCAGYLSMSDADEIEEILAKGQELLALPAPPMSPAKRQAICDSIKADALTTNRSYTAQEMEMCTGLLDGYHLQGYETPVPGTSPGDITPPGDVSAPSQDEYMPSAIPDRKSRFSFMEEKSAKHFGFALGSPISGREKYFGMKT